MSARAIPDQFCKYLFMILFSQIFYGFTLQVLGKAGLTCVTRRAGQSASVIKVSMIDVGICLSSHFKEELAFAADKRLWIISTVMLF